MQTNQGRIDAVIETGNHVYIMEFKVGNAQEAIQQIKDKKYFEKYLSGSKEIILLGVGFSKDDRNLQEYLEERITPN